MDIKPYDLALYVGRFQPLHLGHISAIETALKICDRVLVLVGSAQESGTVRNPFDTQTRMELIKEVFGDKVIVKPLTDLTNENDVNEEWGKYLMGYVKRLMGKAPDIMVYGDEDVKGWFSDEEMKDTMRIVLPRARVDISATEIREFLLRNDRAKFIQYTHSKTHKHFDTLRGELLSTEPYAIAFENLIRANKELKGLSEKETRNKETVLDLGDIDFEKDMNWD